MTAIHWLAFAHLQTIDEIHTASLASVRLRAGALKTAIDPSLHSLTLGETIPADTAVCFIGKLGVFEAASRGRQWLAQLAALRARGGKLILDYTDDHLAFDSSMSAFYREAVSHANACVCSSALLATRLASAYSGRIEVIPDAIEIAPRPPGDRAHKPVSLLWFGHSSNLQYLVDFLPNLERTFPLNLLILTNPEGMQMLRGIQLPKPANLQVQGAVWSPSLMQAEASGCDVCIVPSDPDDPRKAGVSSNRLLTALALGLPTAADRLDSYIEYEDYFAPIRSPRFDDMLANPTGWRDTVLAAQAGPIRTHSLTALGPRWLKLIE